ncbi:hypothetical protein V7S43_019092 [Phytophthora oleae]|uniref:DDE-1 domain-containing protein n=1 Tax=Phytophthora oleae TaxID=2107226 RepID=A0ABD3F2S0_9STRA
MFDPMLDVIHVDEKWFNADKDKRSYLVFEDEKPPPRFFKSKRFIPKTMFLAAFARPRHDLHRNAYWDGILGVWAFTEEYTAQRASRNRAKGTTCVRNLPTIDRIVYKSYLLEYLFPAIKEKWPRKDQHHLIWVQQDNAKPHVSPFDLEVLAAGSESGWNIRLTFQPPNSPDINVCDLGLFAFLQSLQYRKYMRNVLDIVKAVQEAYEEMSKDTLNNIFLTLQSCMRCVLENDGGNDYKLPHLGKAKLRNTGALPLVLPCKKDLYNRAVSALAQATQGGALFFSASTS